MDRDFIANNDGLEKLLHGGVDRLSCGKHSGDDHGAGMSLGDAVAVIEIKHVGEDTVGPGRAWDRQHSTVEERTSSRAAHCLRGEVRGNARGRGSAASHRNGCKINEEQRYVAADVGGDIVPTEFLSEVDDLRGHADRRCASRHWTFP